MVELGTEKALVDRVTIRDTVSSLHQLEVVFTDITNCGGFEDQAIGNDSLLAHVGFSIVVGGALFASDTVTVRVVEILNTVIDILRLTLSIHKNCLIVTFHAESLVLSENTALNSTDRNTRTVLFIGNEVLFTLGA